MPSLETVVAFLYQLMRRSILLLPLLVLSACNLPGAAPIPVAPVTQAASSGQSCYFNWATRPLPEVSSQVQSAMENAGLSDVTAVAEAYGEDCLDAGDGHVVSFSTMETDFRVTVLVTSLGDREKLGRLLEQVLSILDGFPVGTVPGPQAGYIGVTFQSPDDSLRLWFTFDDGRSARAQGLSGLELLDELQKR